MSGRWGEREDRSGLRSDGVAPGTGDRRPRRVNRLLASQLFPGGDAVGRRLKLVNPEQSDAWRTIVGVVGDVRYRGWKRIRSRRSTRRSPTPFMWLCVMVRTPVVSESMVQSAARGHPGRDALDVERPPRRAAVVTVKPGSADPARLAAALYEKARVACTARGGTDRPGLRFSPHFYHLESEIDRAADAVRRLVTVA